MSGSSYSIQNFVVEFTGLLDRQYMYKVKVKEDGRVKVPDTALAVHDHGPRICSFSAGLFCIW